MEPQQGYKSFRGAKSLEELQYNLTKHLVWLRDLKFELEFYMAILDRPIFKNNIMNLFENLSRLKKDISQLEDKRMVLFHQISSRLKHMKKAKGQDNDLSQLFKDNYDDAEKEMFNFSDKISNFKFGFFQYMQSVINQ
ncbi:hypothetical protein [Yeosuana aromativorans]|nr:hypothetical protein [Yeosuana aromativorans]